MPNKVNTTATTARRRTIIATTSVTTICPKTMVVKAKKQRKSKDVPSQQALLKDLQENNAFFDALVDMIPAKLYVAGNSGKRGHVVTM